MKTDDLISAMVVDGGVRRSPLPARFAVAVAAGALVAATLFALGLGVRPDIGSALQTWRFGFKLAVGGLLFALALWACVRLARPDASVRPVLAALAVAPALLAIAVGYELVAVPSHAWIERAIGSNSRICLTAIPLLAIAPLAALLAALRTGAPRSPSAAGAVAGLVAGALAASLYATHCTDDSPLFVVLWYSPAIALVSLAGALAGRWLLRW